VRRGAERGPARHLRPVTALPAGLPGTGRERARYL
jgi:hypothetical protein